MKNSIDSIKAEVVAHSEVPDYPELISFKVTYPRVILAEVNTHRMFSRNTSSSRAIPVERRLESVKDNPWVPLIFGKNRPGMSSGEKVTSSASGSPEDYWREMVEIICDEAQQFMSLFKVHKEVTNRIFESFSHITQIVTTGPSGLSNFFDQRLQTDVQPEMAALSLAMWKAYRSSTPVNQELHIPFRSDIEKILDGVDTRFDDSRLNKLTTFKSYTPREMAAIIISTALCAKVSYDREDQMNLPLSDYFRICERLATDRHYSPFEHCARFDTSRVWSSDNFPWCWVSFRGLFKMAIPPKPLKPEEERAKEIEEWLGLQ